MFHAAFTTSWNLVGGKGICIPSGFVQAITPLD